MSQRCSIIYNDFHWYQYFLIDGIVWFILLPMISSMDVVVYIFFYLFFIYYLFIFTLCKLFIFVLYILHCYILTLWAILACYILRLLNYTSVTSHCQRIDNQNCRSVGKYGLSSTDKQISSGGIPKLEPSSCLIKFLRWLFLSLQRPDDQKSRGVGKSGLYFADAKNLSGGI